MSTPLTPEEREYLSRVRRMTNDAGDKWGLSPNDIAALKWIIDERDALADELAEAKSGWEEECLDHETTRKRRDALAAEVERLDAMCQRTHGVHHSWVAELERWKAALPGVSPEHAAKLWRAAVDRSDALAAEVENLRLVNAMDCHECEAGKAREAQLAAEIEWLRQYARHDEGCNAAIDDAYRCRCGWNDPPGLPATRDAMRNVGPLDEKKEP